MRHKYLSLIIVPAVCLLAQAGCQRELAAENRPQSEEVSILRATPAAQESAGVTSAGVAASQTPVQSPAAEPPGQAAETPKEQDVQPQQTKSSPKISFEQTDYDLGEIALYSNNVAEFKFANEGDEVLNIGDVSKSCGCTPFTLEKKVYQPGEKGVLKVKYQASSSPGMVTKHLYVNSNDKANPKVTLTLKGTVVEKIVFEPKNLRLLPNEENGACPTITIKSVDDVPFAIRGFDSPKDVMKIDIDPQVEAKEFRLQPKVNTENIQEMGYGRLEILLTHPQCPKISIPYNVVPRFRITPPAINLMRTRAGLAVDRTVYLLSNYDEDMEIESVASKEGFVELVNSEKLGSRRYRLNLKITSPPAENGQRLFKDVVTVKIKGTAEKIEIPCVGYYDAGQSK